MDVADLYDDSEKLGVHRRGTSMAGKLAYLILLYGGLSVVHPA